MMVFMFCCCCLIFDTVLLCIALVVPELTLCTGLASNSRDPPSSASQVQGLKMYATTARLHFLSF